MVIAYKSGSILTPAIFKNVDIKNRRVEGYYSAFDNEDSDGDIATKGMTLKTISENGPNSARPRIRHFLDHDVTKGLGKLVDMNEDSHGPWYASQIGRHWQGDDFLKMVEDGIVSEHSYGLQVVKRDKAEPARMLEVKVWEVSSLQSWGANERTPFKNAKGLTVDQQIKRYSERVKALEKFCRNSDATDETLLSLELECKQLTQVIIDLLTTPTPAAEKAPEPGTHENYDTAKLNSLMANINSIKF